MPVYTSHLTDYDALGIGPRIREERRRAGLTLRQLARHSKMPATRLSRIENGGHVLDLEEAIAIAVALGLARHALLPEDSCHPCQISRDADVRDRAAQPTVRIAVNGNPKRAHHGQFWPLADLFVGRHLEPVFGRFTPAAENTPRLYRHHQQEFFFVSEGAVEFLIRTPDGLQREEVQRGDCVTFNSALPHALRAAGATQAETIHVFASRSTEVNSWSNGTMPPRLLVADEDDDAEGSPRGAGQRLRALREAMRATPAHIAELAGLTVSRMQQIERGERPFPIDAMLRLARALGRPLRDFTAESAADGPHYVIHRRRDLATISPRQRRMPNDRPSDAPANLFVPLASGFPTREMFPYLVTVPNAEFGTPRMHSHHGEEFVYVLDGEVGLVTVANGCEINETLRPGDSCYLDSNTPHVLRGQTRNPYAATSASVIVVFWSLLGEDYLFQLSDPIG
jgi:transcriptional regulator with XRE-family HTH domain